MLYYAVSDLGRVRAKNEDFYYVPSETGIIDDMVMVADGLGGHNAGDVASELAVGSICAASAKLRAENAEIKPPQLIRRVMRAANEKVYRHSRENENLTGMATTLTMAVLTASKIYLGHIGDSRAYLIHDNKLTQISADHTVVRAAVRSGAYTYEQALEKFGSHMITKALGLFKVVEPDVSAVSWEPGDRLLLCSDGLTADVSDEEILLTLQAGDIKRSADALVGAAIRGGGKDNITVAVAVNTGKRGVEA